MYVVIRHKNLSKNKTEDLKRKYFNEYLNHSYSYLENLIDQKDKNNNEFEILEMITN